MSNRPTVKSNCYRGVEYEHAVIAFLATRYSDCTRIKNYVINNNIKDAHPFDDILVTVLLDNMKYLVLLQVKHRGPTGLEFGVKKQGNRNVYEIENFYEKLEEIMGSQNVVFQTSNFTPSNLRFGLFCSSHLNFIEDSNGRVSMGEASTVEVDEITKILLPFEITKFRKTNRNNRFFQNVHWCLNQSNLDAIRNDIGADLINFVKRYFENRELHGKGLSKRVFEVERQIQRLSLYFHLPTEVIEVSDNSIDSWNNVISKKNITIFNTGSIDKIENYLYAGVAKKIKSLFTEIDSNKCVTSAEQVLSEETCTNFQKYAARKDIRYWVEVPRNMRSLMLELCKYGEVPLILNPPTVDIVGNNAPSGVNYILLVNFQDIFKDKIYKEKPEGSIIHLSDIDEKSLHNFLKNIIVHLQRRSKLTLNDFFAKSNELQQFCCADILPMIKKDCKHQKKQCTLKCELETPIKMEGTYNRSCSGRTLTKATISESRFDVEKGHIYFISGNISKFTGALPTTEINLGKRALQKYFKSTNRLAIINTNEDPDLWNGIQNYPVFDIYIDENGNRELQKCKHVNVENFSQYISYDSESITYEKFSRLIEARTDIITVIVGELGIGKTSLVEFLCRNCKTKKYIIFYDLKNSYRDFKRKPCVLSAPNKLLFQTESIALQKILLALWKVQRITVILDSYSEVGVDENHKKHVLKFIESIAETKNHIILPVRILDDAFLSKSYNIEIFRLNHLEKHIYVKSIEELGLTEELADDDTCKIVSNPLYLNFLTRLDNIQQLSKFEINKKFIVEEIIERPYRIQDIEMDPEERKIIKKFQQFALLEVNGNEISSILDCSYKKTALAINLKYGIFGMFNNEKNPIFSYTILRNFLCSQWISNNGRDDEKKSVYQQMSEKYTLHVLNMLSENEASHKAVILLKQNEIDDLCNRKEALESKDKLGRIPLHLAIICTKKYSNTTNNNERANHYQQITKNIMKSMKNHNCDFRIVDNMGGNWEYHSNDGGEESNNLPNSWCVHYCTVDICNKLTK